MEITLRIHLIDTIVALYLVMQLLRSIKVRPHRHEFEQTRIYQGMEDSVRIHGLRSNIPCHIAESISYFPMQAIAFYKCETIQRILRK